MKRIAMTIFGGLVIGILLGFSIFPSLIIIKKGLQLYTDLDNVLSILGISIIAGVAYIIFGLMLLINIVLLRFIFNVNSSPVSSEITDSSIFNFAMANSLIAIADKFFLPLIRGTFILNLFYRGLGMKIGKNTLINTLKISDCNLIEIGDNCMIGGDVIINGHSAEGNFLYKGKVIIGNNVSIGSHTTILCGAIISDGISIGANSLVPKNFKINKMGIYGGVPIHLIKEECNINAKKEILISVEQINHKAEIELLKNDDKYVLILNTQYQKLQSEIIAIETFLTNNFVASMGIIFTVLMYSILDDKPKGILTISSISILSASIMMSTTTAMLRVAYKMSEIEIYFQAAGYKLFNWENKFGSLGLSRIKELDGILISGIYIIIIILGIMPFIFDSIIPWNPLVFQGIKVKIIIIFIDSILGLWLILSCIYLNRKTKKYKFQLEYLRREVGLVDFHV